MTNSISDIEAMKEAISEAYDGINNGDGGPFGSVIVKDGKIVGRGHNRVVKNQDPTCHGEIEAIHDACKNLGTFDLSGCTLYTTSEPCPMCLGAILWANIDRVFQGCNISDAEKIGFRDSKFYDFLRGKPGLLTTTELSRDACLKLFEDYSNSSKKKNY
ncbi:MAG: nucleoside deaminase [Treponema sp.]|jgi:tRNA(Arg) A34 adenosine deaminase TadA|nr:nucleoside deaminase [Treponema sp.]